LDDNEFLKKYETFIKTFAYKYCRHEEDKKDFEQELRIRLWKAWQKHYDPEKGKLSTWVYQTLQLHARKLRFDTLKQDIFEKEILNSDFFHKEHYRYDPHFLSVAWDDSLDKMKSNDKFPEFEARIELALTEEEKAIYNLFIRYAPNARISKIARELKLSKRATEEIYSRVKTKVFELHEELYHHI